MCCHIGILEAFHLWSLATSVKAQRSISQLSTNHIAGFLHLSNRPAKCEDPLIKLVVTQYESIQGSLQPLILNLCTSKNANTQNSMLHILYNFSPNYHSILSVVSCTFQSDQTPLLTRQLVCYGCLKISLSILTYLDP